MEEQLIKSFFSKLTDTQFVVFSYYFGINERGICLGITELSRLLKSRNSVVYSSLNSIVNKLNMEEYKFLVMALQKERESKVND